MNDKTVETRVWEIYDRASKLSSRRFWLALFGAFVPVPVGLGLMETSVNAGLNALTLSGAVIVLYLVCDTVERVSVVLAKARIIVAGKDEKGVTWFERQPQDPPPPDSPPAS